MPATLDLEIHEESAPPSWDEELRRGGGVVFHSEAWASYKVQENGGEPLFCLWRERDGSGVVGRAMAIRKPPRRSRAARLANKLVFDSPPATTAPGTDFISPLLAWSRSNSGLVEITLGSFDTRQPWGPAELPHGRARCEFVLQPGDADAVWSGMRQLARRKVKRARKSGLETRLANEPQNLLAFADVHAITEERLRRTRAYVPSDLARERFAAALAELARLGRGRLYGAFRDERLQAGVFFATFGNRAYMVYSGATDAGRELGGPFLVLFDALQDLRGCGHEILNLGGAAGDAADPTSEEHGLHQFKTRFGAEVEPRTSGALLPRPVRARLIQSTRRLVRR
jgi:hypothetical protein